MSKLSEKIHDAIFVEDDKDKKHHPAATPTSVANPVPPAVASDYRQPPQPWPSTPTPTLTENSDIYQQIHDKTDFDQTSAGQILQKYLAPLANIPMDQGQKYKVALAQASAQEGLTVDKVLATFDGLKVALQNEVSTFNELAAQRLDHEVNQRNAQITDVQAQIQQLQAQLQQLSNDAVSAQSKISTASNQFSMAAQRRGIELDQQKVQLANALK
jgi:hypothetical protein